MIKLKRFSKQFLQQYECVSMWYSLSTVYNKRERLIPIHCFKKSTARNFLRIVKLHNIGTQCLYIFKAKSITHLIFVRAGKKEDVYKSAMLVRAYASQD